MQPETHRTTVTRRRFLHGALTLFGGALAMTSFACGRLPTRQPGSAPGKPSGEESAALSQEFVGITNDGSADPDLYPLAVSGVSTSGVRAAAEAYLASLSAEQRARSVFGVDDAEWRKWSNVDNYTRQGISFQDLSQEQRTAGFELMGAALSAKGFKLSRDIMRLNTTEGELLRRLDSFNEWLYYVTIMGTPSDTEPWGFQVDGHHLVINYFVLGDQVVMSPVFMGAEPPVATSGTYAGLSVLQQEQNAGLAFVNAIPIGKRDRVIIQTSKTGSNILAEAFKDNLILDYAGVPAAEFEDGLQDQLLDLIDLYVSNLDAGHARVRMSEVRSRLEETRFAWIGETGPDSAFYYRIHSPVILIEFDHPSPGPAGAALGSKGPSRNHIHTVVRTPNGNDYGMDYLRQHHARFEHVNGRHILRP